MSENHSRVLDRFVLKTKKAKTGCIEWQGSLRKRLPYGQFWDGQTMTRAHSFSYSAFIGAIPSGFSVLHTCDNPQCVNPCHLFLGTQADNVADMVNKGRQSGRKKPWEPNKGTKLTAADILEIRQRCSAGEPQARVAKSKGIAQSNVSLIVQRITWKHVP